MAIPEAFHQALLALNCRKRATSVSGCVLLTSGDDGVVGSDWEVELLSWKVNPDIQLVRF